ncbi:hypothetical protein BDZ85DRAFT_8305 [Elsinoe ampelina]|uniref:Uncharacterized protein n=1 Tax=Elsinoe ampelina TaxID=302913 RepID=A0A6A6GQ11_9PEZI|nr:hypothetical protein BDZ85DRAFT_8305 [Elsinoe ampelina]
MSDLGYLNDDRFGLKSPVREITLHEKAVPPTKHFTSEGTDQTQIVMGGAISSRSLKTDSHFTTIPTMSNPVTHRIKRLFDELQGVDEDYDVLQRENKRLRSQLQISQTAEKQSRTALDQLNTQVQELRTQNVDIQRQLLDATRKPQYATDGELRERMDSVFADLWNWAGEMISSLHHMQDPSLPRTNEKLRPTMPFHDSFMPPSAKMYHRALIINMVARLTHHQLDKSWYFGPTDGSNEMAGFSRRAGRFLNQDGDKGRHWITETLGMMSKRDLDHVKELSFARFLSALDVELKIWRGFKMPAELQNELQGIFFDLRALMQLVYLHPAAYNLNLSPVMSSGFKFSTFVEASHTDVSGKAVGAAEGEYQLTGKCFHALFKTSTEDGKPVRCLVLHRSVIPLTSSQIKPLCIVKARVLTERVTELEPAHQKYY